MVPVLKKLLSLLMSLLICFALLPGQARAGDLPEAGVSSAEVEFLDEESPSEAEYPVMPAWADEFPDTDGASHGEP